VRILFNGINVIKYTKKIDNMRTFKDLEFKENDTHMNSGIFSTMMFENGYGVSVIRTQMSYGNKEGLFELAVLDSTGDITYDTPITSDVLGWLTEDDVSRVMGEVQSL
jgi:hypothetical protein